MSNMEEENSIKCVLVGDRDTGKSALIEAFVKENKEENFHLTFDTPTVIEKSTKVDKRSNQVLNIWELGGNNTDDKLRRNIGYPKADVVIITFSKIDPASFESVKEKWAPEVHAQLPDVPIIVVGTKDEIKDEAVHLEDDSIITEAEGRAATMGGSVNGKKYFECSAKENKGIGQIFSNAVELALARRKRIKEANIRKGSKKVSTLTSQRKWSALSDSVILPTLNTAASTHEDTINEFPIQGNETFLSLEKDDDCLNYLKEDYNEVAEKMKLFYVENGQNILHIIVQRKFVKSLKFVLEQHPSDAERMVSEMDTNHRTPLMVAFKSKESYDMIETFMENKNVNFTTGKDSKGTESHLILWYVHYKLNKLAKSILSKADKNELKILLNVTDDEHNTILMKAQSQSLALYMIHNYADQIDIRAVNLQSKNVAHKFAKQGFDVSALLAKLENSKEDTFKILSEPDHHGNTPLMASAKYNNGNALLSFLTFYHTQKQEDYKEDIKRMLHNKNKDGNTLLFLAYQRKSNFQSQYGMIKELERYVHTDEDPNKAKQGYLRCLREQQISKMELKDIKSDDEANAEVSNLWTWIILSFGALWIPLATYSTDISSDSILTISYFTQWKEGMENVTKQWKEGMENATFQLEEGMENATFQLKEGMENATFQWKEGMEDATFCNLNTPYLTRFEDCFDPLYKFSYSCIFMLLPWMFYLHEFVTSEIFRRLVKIWRIQGNFAWENLRNGAIVKSIKPYLKSISAALLLPLVFITWPVCTKFIHFYYVFRYRTSSGEEKVRLENKMWDSALYAARAHILEVCTEASFQPLLQWYQLFPKFLKWYYHLDVDKIDYTVYIKDVKSHWLVFSLVSSIFSLGWSFSVYKVAQKRGTLDLGENLAGRIVLFFSNLFLVVARLQAIIMFTYYFGPGKFFPSLIFIACHVILISVLHGVFSEVKGIWKTQKKRVAMICLINGLANIFLHNNIGIDDINKTNEVARWKPTFARQLTFDVIFLVENAILTTVGALNEVEPLNRGYVKFYIIGAISSCHLLGLIFKYVYYKKLHTWSFLNDTVKITDHHFKLEFNYFLLDETRTSTFTFPYLCFLPNKIKDGFKIFTVQVRRNLSRQSNNEIHEYGWASGIVVGILSVPFYALLIVLAVIILILITVFIILGIPLFLAGRLFFNCCRNKIKRRSIKTNPEQSKDDQEKKEQNENKNSPNDHVNEEENEALLLSNETNNVTIISGVELSPISPICPI